MNTTSNQSNRFAKENPMLTVNPSAMSTLSNHFLYLCPREKINSVGVCKSACRGNNKEMGGHVGRDGHNGRGFLSFWTASMGAAASLLRTQPCAGGLARRVFGSRRCVPVDRRTARKERAGVKVVTLLRIPKAQNAFIYSIFENQAAKWQRLVATSDCIQ